VIASSVANRWVRLILHTRVRFLPRSRVSCLVIHKAYEHMQHSSVASDGMKNDVSKDIHVRVQRTDPHKTPQNIPASRAPTTINVELMDPGAFGHRMCLHVSSYAYRIPIDCAPRSLSAFARRDHASADARISRKWRSTFAISIFLNHPR